MITYLSSAALYCWESSCCAGYLYIRRERYGSLVGRSLFYLGAGAMASIVVAIVSVIALIVGIWLVKKHRILG